MTVAVDASMIPWGPGGTSTYVRKVLEAAQAHGEHDWQVFTNHRSPGFGLPHEHPVRLKGGFAWRNLAVLPRLLREPPQVYWAPWPRAPLLLPCPLVLTVLDLAPLIFRGSKGRGESVALDFSLRWHLRRARAVLAISQTTKDDLIRRYGVDPDLVRVVPLAADASFAPAARLVEAESEVQRRWGLDEPFVLVAGTLEPRKGLEVLCELATRPDAPMILFAGREGWGSSEVVSRLTAAPRARLLGAVTDGELLTLYQAAACVALPSLYEGFGLTALESLACGTPVVISESAGSLNEYFQSIAVVAAERTGHAWHQAVRDAMELKSVMATAGPEFAARFSWSVTASQTLEVLAGAADHV